MNAVNAMLRDEQEAALDAAVANANRWIHLARPIIVATMKLEDLGGDITRGSSFDHRDHLYRTLKEARGEVERACAALNEILPGIRDDFIADESRPYRREASEAETEANDAFNDALSEETITVAEAVKMIEREWNEAFAKGKPL